MFNFSKNPKISKCFADHGQDVASCYEKFEEFFKILFSENPDKNALQSAKTAVDTFEFAADAELRHVVDSMSGAFLPVTRNNLITIVQCTDEVANECQEIVREVWLENIQVPAEVRSDLLEIIAITKGQLDILYNAVDKLLNDYKGLNADRKILDDIRAEESRVDGIEAMLHARIFELDLSLCEKIYYKDLLENVCNISDIIEDISDKIQVMLVEREA